MEKGKNEFPQKDSEGIKGVSQTLEEYKLGKATDVIGEKIDSALEKNMLKRELRRDVYKWLENTQKHLSFGYYRTLERIINIAKEEGVNVSDVEVQLPELKRKLEIKLRAEVDKLFAEAKAGLSSYSLPLTYLEEYIDEAEKAGVDVSDIKAQMPEVKRQVLRAGVDKWFAEAKAELSRDSLFFLKMYIDNAEKAGVDVSDIKAQMPELKRQIDSKKS